MSGRLPRVAIVGRANVGKSTLVNRLLGRRAAIEHPEPGVTRDRQSYDLEWDGFPFTLIDTGGWEPQAKGLTAKVRAQAERAAREADLVVMVADVETGITEDDLVVARGLRQTTVPVLLVANKADSSRRDRESIALDRLGLGPAIPVSALHGRGAGDLLSIMVEHLRSIDPAPERPEDDALRVALVGRPNVGKSSLFNRLVDDDRSIVHDAPGTTRDTVDTVVEIDGNRYRFIDTAGMRRRAKADSSGPEYYGLVRSFRAIDEADVALLVIDAREGPTEQDQKIASRVAEAGCACVIVLNKWDLLEAEEVDDIAADTQHKLRFLSWAPLVRTSALTKRGVVKLVPAVEFVRASWQQRIPTAMLNAWVREGLDRVPLGTTPRARPVRIRYLTQARTRPPEFILFTNGRLGPTVTRAVENRLRERFGFEGTPVRVTVRVGSNDASRPT